VNLVAATVDGLKHLRRPEEVGRLRGKTVAEVLGIAPRGNGNGAAAPPDPVAQPAAAAEPVAAEPTPAEAAPLEPVPAAAGDESGLGAPAADAADGPTESA
jgi:hypothetical protein